MICFVRIATGAYPANHVVNPHVLEFLQLLADVVWRTRHHGLFLQHLPRPLGCPAKGFPGVLSCALNAAIQCLVAALLQNVRLKAPTCRRHGRRHTKRALCGPAFTRHIGSAVTLGSDVRVDRRPLANQVNRGAGDDTIEPALCGRPDTALGGHHDENGRVRLLIWLGREREPGDGAVIVDIGLLRRAHRMVWNACRRQGVEPPFVGEEWLCPRLDDDVPCFAEQRTAGVGIARIRARVKRYRIAMISTSPQADAQAPATTCDPAWRGPRPAGVDARWSRLRTRGRYFSARSSMRCERTTGSGSGNC